jgi:hypothetical protein
MLMQRITDIRGCRGVQRLRKIDPVDSGAQGGV